MAKQAAAVVVVLVVVLGVALVAQAPSGLMFRGWFVDGSTGDPVPASVTVFMLVDGRLQTNTATGDETGGFELGVPARPYSALVWADRYAPQEIEQPDLDLGVVRLDLFKDLRGILLDSRGHPVRGAAVRASYVDSGRYTPEWLAEGLTVQRPVTDSAGAFVLRSVVPGRPLAVQAFSGHRAAPGGMRPVSRVETVVVERALSERVQPPPVVLVARP